MSFWFNLLAGFFMILALGLAVYSMKVNYDQQNDFDKRLNDMREEYSIFLNSTDINASELKNSEGFGGMAYGDYFCVWTKDQNITHTLEICTHEYAHNNLGLLDPYSKRLNTT